MGRSKGRRGGLAAPGGVGPGKLCSGEVATWPGQQAACGASVGTFGGGGGLR
jgi:hypothetical protein